MATPTIDRSVYAFMLIMVCAKANIVDSTPGGITYVIMILEGNIVMIFSINVATGPQNIYKTTFGKMP